MAKYKYRMVQNKGWRFELLPNNSNHQYVGHSDKYPTKEDMLDGLNKFKSFMRAKREKIKYQQSIVESKESNLYFAFFVFSKNNERFFTRNYYHKSEIKKAIIRVSNNFDTGIRNDLTIEKEG